MSQVRNCGARITYGVQQESLLGLSKVDLCGLLCVCCSGALNPKPYEQVRCMWPWGSEP